jgi:hypothetical protein
VCREPVFRHYILNVTPEQLKALLVELFSELLVSSSGLLTVRVAAPGFDSPAHDLFIYFQKEVSTLGEMDAALFSDLLNVKERA